MTEGSSREYYATPNGPANRRFPHGTTNVKVPFDSSEDGSNNIRGFDVWQEEPSGGEMFFGISGSHRSLIPTDNHATGTEDRTNTINASAGPQHHKSHNQNSSTNHIMANRGELTDQFCHGHDSVYGDQFANTHYDNHGDKFFQQNNNPVHYFELDFDGNAQHYPLEYEDNFQHSGSGSSSTQGMHQPLRQVPPHFRDQNLVSLQNDQRLQGIQTTIPTVPSQQRQHQQQQHQNPQQHPQQLNSQQNQHQKQQEQLHQQQPPPPPKAFLHGQDGTIFNSQFASQSNNLNPSSYDDLFGLGVGESFSNHPQTQMPPPPSQLQKLTDFTVKVPTVPVKDLRRRKKPTHMHISIEDLPSQPVTNLLSMPLTADGQLSGLGPNSTLNFETDLFSLNDNITPFMNPPLMDNAGGYFEHFQSPPLNKPSGEMSSYFMPHNNELSNLQEQNNTGAILREEYRSPPQNTNEQSYNQLSPPKSKAHLQQGQFWVGTDNQVPLKRKYPDSPEDYKYSLGANDAAQDRKNSDFSRQLESSSLHHRRVQSTGKLTEKRSEKVHKDAILILSKNPTDDSNSHTMQRKITKPLNHSKLLPGERPGDREVLQSASSSDTIDSGGQNTGESSAKKRSAKGSICPVCNRFIKRDFTRHRRIHDEVGRFKCVYPKGECKHKSQYFNRPYDYKKHLLHDHFTFENEFGKSTKLLTDKLPLRGKCNSCGQTFKASEWLDNHVLTTDPEGRCPGIAQPVEALESSPIAGMEELDNFEHVDEEDY